MKICSQCNRTYPDHNMKFCLSDGTPLVYDSLEEITVVNSPPPPPPPPAHFQQTERQGISPAFAYLGAGLLAFLLIGGAVVMWIKFGSSDSPNAKNEASRAVSNSIEQKPVREQEPTSEAKAELQEERALLEKEKQKLADERKKLETKRNKPVEAAVFSQPSSAAQPTERIKFHRGSTEEIISGSVNTARKFVLRTMSGQYLSATVNSSGDCVVFDNGSTNESYATISGDSGLNLVNNCRGGAASFSMTVSVR